MILQHLSLVNYKNIAQAELQLSPNVNCFIGRNGMGKTNVLDAIYFLSFGKSSHALTDAQCIQHEADFLMTQGKYLNALGEEEHIVCALKRGQRKRLRRNDKEYKRLSEHVGVVPLIMISPSDSLLITGGNEERRKLLDMVISQLSSTYLEALMRYNKTLQQRNALLKQEAEPDAGLMEVLESMMAQDADIIYKERAAMIEGYRPIFQGLYKQLCSTEKEEVDFNYESHASRGSLDQLLREGRTRERIVGYTLYGPHRDKLDLLMNGYDVRREGSQGQSKTYFIAMKLAQFLYLKTRGERRTPILLLDDIFDKLDAGRVACIVDYVSGEDFGQIFITDTNREHLDSILAATTHSYQLFEVEEGCVRSLLMQN